MTNRAPKDLTVHIARYQLRVVAPSGNHPDAVRRRKLIEEMKYQEEAGTHLEWVLQALLEKANNRFDSAVQGSLHPGQPRNEREAPSHGNPAEDEGGAKLANDGYQEPQIKGLSADQKSDEASFDSHVDPQIEVSAPKKPLSQMPRGLSVM